MVQLLTHLSMCLIAENKPHLKRASWSPANLFDQPSRGVSSAGTSDSTMIPTIALPKPQSQSHLSEFEVSLPQPPPQVAVASAMAVLKKPRLISRPPRAAADIGLRPDGESEQACQGTSEVQDMAGSRSATCTLPQFRVPGIRRRGIQPPFVKGG